LKVQSIAEKTAKDHKELRYCRKRLVHTFQNVIFAYNPLSNCY